VKAKLKSGENMGNSYLSNLTLARRTRVKEAHIHRKLEEYFSAILPSDKLDLLLHKATSVSVSGVRRLGGSNDVYSFLLTYGNIGYEQRSNLVLKAYVKNLEPVLNKSINKESFSRLSYTYPQLYCGNLERCVKEFQVLKGLERVGYPAPRACLFEHDSNVIGYPFIIMLNESNQNSTCSIGYFAKTLARLHSFSVDTLGIDALKAPEDEYAFAKRSLLYFKILLNLLPKHSKELKKDFEFVIRWLESNVSNTSCPKYCLLHGDYRLNNNTILTPRSRMIVLDWEEAEIGDPAYDVGYAYAYIRAEFGEKTADQFVQEYLKYSDGDLAKRLFFYKLVGLLGWGILHSSVLSNPLKVYEIRGAEAFLLFPFLRLPFIAKMTGTGRDVMWVDCFKEFVRENFRR
jgi:thiamine kinase-like enzyme